MTAALIDMLSLVKMLLHENNKVNKTNLENKKYKITMLKGRVFALELAYTMSKLLKKQRRKKKAGQGSGQMERKKLKAIENSVFFR